MSLADWTLEPLEFEPPTTGHCCAFCNPHALADYEVSCVAVRRQGGNRVYVCTSCVQLLGRALRQRATQTNAADRSRWAKLVAAAESAKSTWAELGAKSLTRRR